MRNGVGEGGRALAAAEDRWNAGAGRQLGAAIDRRHREIEFRTFGPPGQCESNGMKQRFPLLTRARLHTVRRSAKLFAVEPRRAAASSSASATTTAARGVASFLSHQRLSSAAAGS
jgi:hypothetical protein